MSGLAAAFSPNCVWTGSRCSPVNTRWINWLKSSTWSARRQKLNGQKRRPSQGPIFETVHPETCLASFPNWRPLEETYCRYVHNNNWRPFPWPCNYPLFSSSYAFARFFSFSPRHSSLQTSSFLLPLLSEENLFSHVAMPFSHKHATGGSCKSKAQVSRHAWHWMMACEKSTRSSSSSSQCSQLPPPLSLLFSTPVSSIELAWLI